MSRLACQTVTALKLSDPIHFSLGPVFEPVVTIWLDQTAKKTRQWADQVSQIRFARCRS